MTEPSYGKGCKKLLEGRLDERPVVALARDGIDGLADIFQRVAKQSTPKKNRVTGSLNKKGSRKAIQRRMCERQRRYFVSFAQVTQRGRCP